MAMLISRATGNFTAAATWGVADSATGSQLTNPSASTTTTTSYVYSSTFTGTNTKVADGVALFLSRVNAIGTFTVALSDDNGVTATRAVTVNASDLPTTTAWVFFKFGTTLTLDGGTDYRVGILGSSAGNVTVYRDATAGNWARIVSTTDTAAPTAGDTMLIAGELTGAGANSTFTVTMDNTATTDFGNGTSTAATAPTQTNPQNFNGIQIGNRGTLTWGASAATAYYLKLSGNLIVWSGGTYNMGTVATPCPRDSSMYLQLDCAADNDFGVFFFDGSTANMQGLSRTSGKDVWYCKLNTDEAVASTSLGVDTDTGWLDNDEIAVASTTRTAAQSENGALNGAAGANTLTVDGFAGAGGGLANAHSGASPTQAEVILLTRNVRISGGSSLLMANIVVGPTATCDFDWAEFFWISSSARVGLSVQTTSGSFNMQYCCVRNGEGLGLSQTQTTITGTVSITNCSFYRIANTGGSGAVSLSNTGTAVTPTFSNNIIIYPTGPGIQINRATVNNNVVAGCTGDGYYVYQNPASLSGNVAHSAGGTGYRILPLVAESITITDGAAWRCTGFGISVQTIGTFLVVNGFTAFGNQTSNIGISVSGCSISLNNVTLNGDTTFATTNGFAFSASSSYPVTITNSTFGVASGILTAHTNDINVSVSFAPVMASLSNVTLASSTEVTGTANLTSLGYIKSSKHDQTTGAFRSWFQGGRIDRDTTIFNTASPSERLTPSSASIKLASGSRIVAVDNGTTITINAYVRKSVAGDGAAYNGNQPRLILKANPSCGINSDTVLDTMTVAAGSWEQLTGTTATVNSDGALEFVVDCDGTTGWVNVDDWSVT